MISCSLSAFTIIYSIFTIISEIILLLVSILFYFYQFYYYMDNQFCWNDIIYLSAILVYQYEWYYQYRYWYQYSFQIPVSKWSMISILILIEYYLQQSSIRSITYYHQISKNRWNIYSFMTIHKNTSDWFEIDIPEWIWKMNCC